MRRGLMVTFGIGLTVLWLAGLGSVVPSWMIWLDLVASVCAFGIAVVLDDEPNRAKYANAPIILGLGLGVLWIVELVSGIPAWITWWNFAFSCAFIVFGLSLNDEKYVGAKNRGELESEYPNLSNDLIYGSPLTMPPPPQGMGLPRQNKYGRGPRHYQRSDGRIEEEINERLMQHWAIDASEIDVRVVAQEVTLRGTVDTRRERRVAEEIADSVLGVRDVHNEIHVRSQTDRAA